MQNIAITCNSIITNITDNGDHYDDHQVFSTDTSINSGHDVFLLTLYFTYTSLYFKMKPNTPSQRNNSKL